MDESGVVVTRQNPLTGSTVILVDGRVAGLDTKDGKAPWTMICEAHGTALQHTSKREATRWLPVPHQWCEDCMKIVENDPQAEERVTPKPKVRKSSYPNAKERQFAATVRRMPPEERNKLEDEMVQIVKHNPSRRDFYIAVFGKIPKDIA